jgi:hypothetical protein
MGDNYYPGGGIEDYATSFSTEEEAEKYIKGVTYLGHDWAEIVKTTENGNLISVSKWNNPSYSKGKWRKCEY